MIQTAEAMLISMVWSKGSISLSRSTRNSIELSSTAADISNALQPAKIKSFPCDKVNWLLTDQHLLFSSLLIDVWYNITISCKQLITSSVLLKCVSISLVLNFAGNVIFGSYWSVLPSWFILNGTIFQSKVTVKVSVMLRFLLLPAKPTRVEFFGAIVVRLKETYFDDVWSLLSTRDFGMSYFYVILTIRKWRWSLASFLAPQGTSTFLVAATRLRNLNLWRILCS